MITSMTTQEKKLTRLILHHKESVAIWLAKFSAELAYRAAMHDNSKFTPEEFGVYADNVDDFSKHEFGSEKELQLREKLLPAAKVHHSRNRHHPEHFENGIDDMNLIDLIEMLADWKSASERTPDDSLRKGMAKLKVKHKISPQLVKILENTARDFRMY